MSVDVDKLKNVVTKPGGSLVAQCPACAAAGGDKTGNHLIVYPGGKFGCVANQGDAKHNKEILKLVGDGKETVASPKRVVVRPYKIQPVKVVQDVPSRTLEELGYRNKDAPF